jgi:hypothetical protein
MFTHQGKSPLGPGSKFDEGRIIQKRYYQKYIHDDLCIVNNGYSRRQFRGRQQHPITPYSRIGGQAPWSGPKLGGPCHHITLYLRCEDYAPWSAGFQEAESGGHIDPPKNKSYLQTHKKEGSGIKKLILILLFSLVSTGCNSYSLEDANRNGDLIIGPPGEINYAKIDGFIAILWKAIQFSMTFIISVKQFSTHMIIQEINMVGNTRGNIELNVIELKSGKSQSRMILIEMNIF